MGFLSPWFLGGLLAVGLPLWMHLLKQHKTIPQLFSSLMFFEKRTQSSVKHRRLRYLALLALRLALIILLALLFANPFYRRTLAAGEGNQAAVIVVDHSFSMRAGDRLEKAKQQALAAIRGLAPGRPARILALGSTVEALTQVSSDKGELGAAVESIQPGDGRGSYGELVKTLKSLAASGPLEVRFFTDLQRSAMPPSFTDLRMPDNSKLILQSVGNETAPNWAVENVAAPRHIYDPKKARVQVTIAGYGTPAAKKTVSLVLNGKPLATKTVDVPAGGRATAEFLGIDAPYGFNKGEVTVDGNDALAADDRFLFSSERGDPRKALLIHDGRQARSAVYVRAAIDASSEAAFQIESLTDDQAANADLSKFAWILLADLAAPPPALDRNLLAFVKRGGGVLITMGPGSASRPRTLLADDPIDGSRYAAREGDLFQTAGEIDTGHPALRKVGKFEGVKFYQSVRVRPEHSRVLAKMADQSALLLERKIGEGRVLTLTSSLDNISNDFPLHASFVPFMEQSANYLAGLEEQSGTIVVGSFVELRSDKSQAAAAEVTGPDGKRVLSLQEATTAPNFQVREEGFYELKRPNGRQELIAVRA
ncbi:MAG: BatA domain-containing protein, partial [Bryobacteraceae bacterium]